jgi:hypothetical protein
MLNDASDVKLKSPLPSLFSFGLAISLMKKHTCAQVDLRATEVILAALDQKPTRLDAVRQAPPPRCQRDQARLLDPDASADPNIAPSLNVVAREVISFPAATQTSAL